MEGPSFVIGNIAKGEDFWNREAEVADIWKALEKDNVLLKAPRRFGKTSIMNHLFENPPDGFKAFFLDAEGMREPEEFISGVLSTLLEDETLRSLYQKTTGLIGKLLGSMELGAKFEGLPEIRIRIREGLKKDWQEEGRKLISQLKGFKGNILIILDELPELIKHIEKNRGRDAAVAFLHWFRAVRQTPSLSRVRWLVGGSIGIEHIVDSVGAGIKTINDFANVRVGPFSKQEAKGFIKELLQSEGDINRLSKPSMEKLLDTIGAPVPYFIQILLKECVYEAKRRRRKSLTAEIIERAYREGVLGPTNRNYFDHYYSRLKEYYEPDTDRTAKRLLLEIARKGNAPKSDLFRLFKQTGRGMDEAAFSYLMSDLENDFYIAYDADGGSYSFSTKVLRDWWLRYYDLVEE